jgi:4-amino-4-deoxy-L-arabinose transferase-like glycosyltransferase
VILPRRRAPAVLGVAILAALVLFWRLGEPTFWDPDEAHYAVSTHELLETGDWLAPTYNGEPYFDKPVLFHQIQAISMLALGQNELGARAPSALAGVALVWATWWLGAALVSADVGLIAALLLLTCPAVFALARYAILDMTFTAFLFTGAGLLTVATVRNRPGLQWAGYLCLAMAVCVKGPVALALCGLAFLLSIAVSPSLRPRLLGLRWGVGLLIVAAVASPWFVYMYQRFGQAFVQGYTLNENLLLFAKPLYANQPGWTFYLQIMAVGLLPWTPVLMGRAYDALRDVVTGRAVDPAETALWCWVVAVVGFFSASQFKLDHYVFPAAPALYLLVARSWADVRGECAVARHSGIRTGFLFVGPVLAVAGVVSGWLLVVRLALPPAALMLPVAFVTAGVVLTGPRHAQRADSPWIVAAAFGVLYLVVLSWVVPSLEQQKVVAELARAVPTVGGRAPRLCTYQLNRWTNSFLFYTKQRAAVLDEPDAFARFVNEDGPFFCVVPESSIGELDSVQARFRVTRRAEGLWATSGRALWKKRGAPTAFLVVERP